MPINEEFINGLQVEEAKIIDKISVGLDIPERQVKATVDLLNDGNTIPFISRYRKEVTGSLDETQVREISDRQQYLTNLETRKIEVARSIFGQGKLTDELYKNIQKCPVLSELEDLYAPYKKKKKTRGMLAIERGLEPLADAMMSGPESEIEAMAAQFVDGEKGVNSADEALQGAMDIIAERFSQDVDLRKACYDYIYQFGKVMVEGTGDAENSVYQMYYEYEEPIRLIKGHRVLAINRGEKEGELTVKIDYDYDALQEELLSLTKPANVYHKSAVNDGLKRLMAPAILRLLRSDLSENADEHSIEIFSENLRNLLLSPPIRRTRVLGIDPGIRTGSKAAALDENGKFLSYFTFFDYQPDTAKKRIAETVQKHDVQLIAIGNGTGTREVQQMVADTLSEFGLDVQYTVVDEDGASVYSASELAGKEFPELDLTIRGAISIGRRLQDPLAELVKIDPKSIGVGQYQHDVNQKMLSKTLDAVVESVVNNVGVNLNTASASLLKYVSGISGSLAENIVGYRDTNGTIRSRDELKKVPGMGDKTFEQAAGFLMIPESTNPLDNSWVHPENYVIADQIRGWLEKGAVDKAARQELKEKYDVGKTTLDDLISELKKPRRDPREDYPMPIMQKGVVQFDDLKPGMKVTGKVKNVVDFGAFVDIGIKETALVHISELSDRYVKHPMDVVKVGDIVEATIIAMDKSRKRISLSCKKDPELKPV